MAAGKTGHKVYAGHLGLGRYFIDNLSLALEAIGYYADHDNDSPGSGLDCLLRWHYLTRQAWSLYMDGGTGFIYTRNTLIDHGTHFNFTVQAGLGMTYNFRKPIMPIAGVRWFHMSNARIQGKDRNMGFDSPQLYLGLMILL